MFDFELVKYIYWEYTIAVMFLTEGVMQLIKNTRLQWIVTAHPKWITLIVAVLCAVGDWIFIDRGEPNYYQILISFGLAVIGYDYGLKLLKDLFLKVKETFIEWKASK